MEFSEIGSCAVIERTTGIKPLCRPTTDPRRSQVSAFVDLLADREKRRRAALATTETGGGDSTGASARPT
jgi:hypothetical protein